MDLSFILGCAVGALMVVVGFLFAEWLRRSP